MHSARGAARRRPGYLGGISLGATIERQDAVRLGTVEVPYVFKRMARRRHVHILVNAEGTIEVRSPWRFSRAKAREAMRENAQWVLATLESVRSRLAQQPRLVTGTRLPRLDESLRLEVRPRAQIDLFGDSRPRRGRVGTPGHDPAGEPCVARRRGAARVARELVSPRSRGSFRGSHRTLCAAARGVPGEDDDPGTTLAMGKLLRPGNREPQLAPDAGPGRARRLRRRPRAVSSPAHGPLVPFLGDGGERRSRLPAAPAPSRRAPGESSAIAHRLRRMSRGASLRPSSACSKPTRIRGAGSWAVGAPTRICPCSRSSKGSAMRFRARFAASRPNARGLGRCVTGLPNGPGLRRTSSRSGAFPSISTASSGTIRSSIGRPEGRRFAMVAPIGCQNPITPP